MVRAELKSLFSYDLPDAESLPDDPSDCCVGMTAVVGPPGVDGGDDFSFEVCTASSLARRFDDEGRPFWARGVLLVEAFNWNAVEAAVHQRVNSVEGNDWVDVATKLNRFWNWEFEDYRPHAG